MDAFTSSTPVLPRVQGLCHPIDSLEIGLENVVATFRGLLHMLTAISSPAPNRGLLEGTASHRLYRVLKAATSNECDKAEAATGCAVTVLDQI